MIHRITLVTGRHYDGPQSLAITVKYDAEFGADAFTNGEATFIDASRHIAGFVTVPIFEWDRPEDIARAVLNMYDAGRYTLA